MSRTYHLLGVPSSAAAHWPGQEKAPEALRAGGLLARLEQDGTGVIDRGDLALSRWQIERTLFDGHLVNNLGATVSVAEQVSAEVTDILRAGGFPVVIGGDCTITVGAFAGTLRAGLDPALVYVDGGWDLSTPADYPAGVLDSMGLAHLLGAEGTTRLRDIGPRFPMLSGDRCIQIGHTDADTGSRDRELIEQFGLASVPAEIIRSRGVGAAREALSAHLDERQSYFLHFDVDVIDFFDFPVADVAIHSGATSFADVQAVVTMLVADPRCIGMTVTEFNPDHGHPDGREAVRLATFLALCLTAAA